MSVYVQWDLYGGRLTCVYTQIRSNDEGKRRIVNCQWPASLMGAGEVRYALIICHQTDQRH